MYEANKMTLIPYMNCVGALSSLSNNSFDAISNSWKWNISQFKHYQWIQLYEETDNFRHLSPLKKQNNNFFEKASETIK